MWYGRLKCFTLDHDDRKCLFACLFPQCPLKKTQKVCRHLDPSLTHCNSAVTKKMQNMVMWNRQVSFLFYIVNIYKYKKFICMGIGTLAGAPCKVKQVQELFESKPPQGYTFIGKIRVCPK